MPKKVKLEDGSEIEIPTEEELKGLNEKASKSDELSKKVSELEADSQNRNWSALRKQNEKMKELLKSQSKEIDEEGNIKDFAKTFSQEDVQKMVQESTNKALLEQHINMSIRGLDENKRKVVLANYGKLSTGEDVNLENVDNFIKSAMSASGISTDANNLSAALGSSAPYSRGVAPAGDKDKGFAESEAGKGLANSLGIETEVKN